MDADDARFDEIMQKVVAACEEGGAGLRNCTCKNRRRWRVSERNCRKAALRLVPKRRISYDDPFQKAKKNAVPHSDCGGCCWWCCVKLLPADRLGPGPVLSWSPYFIIGYDVLRKAASATSSTARSLTRTS